MTTSEITLDEYTDWDYDSYSFQHVSLNRFDDALDDLFPSQKSFAERVQLLSDQNMVSSFLVDSCILVKGPNDQMRSLAVKNWESKKGDATWWGRFHLLGGVASLALAAASAPFFGYLTIASLVASVAEGVFSVKSYRRGDRAQTQIDKWNKHPAQDVADARERAYRLGFFYCLNQGLKGDYDSISPNNILHPSEVTWLYEKALEEMMQDISAISQRRNVSPTEKKRWVESFIAKNPLALRAISYAYEKTDLKRQILEAWSASFEAFRLDVLSVQKHFLEKAAQIYAQVKQKSEKLEEQRSLALALPHSLLRANNYEAKKVYQNRLDEEGLSEAERAEALAAYNQALKDNQAYYLTFSSPINYYYDRCAQDVRAWETDCLARLEQEKSLGIEPYFQPGLDLFLKAYTSWVEQKQSDEGYYKSQNFTQEDCPSIPSAPSLPEVLIGA